jgi:hypothetical protein
MVLNKCRVAPYPMDLAVMVFLAPVGSAKDNNIRIAYGLNV